MKIKFIKTCLTVLPICFLFAVACNVFESDEEIMFLTTRLTVNGEIQTDDAWTTGATSVNEWAKPIYRIWIDMNGNPNDGPYGNGQGIKQAEIWLDTGNLNFLWFGPDNEYGTHDDVIYIPVFKIKEDKQKANDIEAVITNNGKTLEVTLPLKKIGEPSSLDISFMASPWTTSACDNLGQGAGSVPCWITVSDVTVEGTFFLDDDAGDRQWPALTPNLADNFDLIKAEVILEMK